MRFAFNMLLAASVVSIAAWLSRRFPIMAGFIVALPLNSLMVLPLSSCWCPRRRTDV